MILLMSGFGTVLLSIAIIAGTLWVIARMGGWADLGRHYTHKFTPTQHRNWRSVGLQFGGYNNCVKIGVDKRALYLALPKWLSFFHPPLAIPFSELTLELKDGASRGRLVVDRTSHINLYLFATDIDWVEAEYAAMKDD